MANSGAGAFPPPLWGRDREGGGQHTPAHVATPLPNPPPQGGREKEGARSTDRNHIAQSNVPTHHSPFAIRRFSSHHRVADSPRLPRARENRICGIPD